MFDSSDSRDHSPQGQTLRAVYRKYWPVFLSLLVALIGSLASWRVFVELHQAHHQSVQRQVEQMAEFLESDLMSGFQARLAAHRRMAQRVARDFEGVSDRWTQDALQYRRDFPYIRSLELLSPTFQGLARVSADESSLFGPLLWLTPTIEPAALNPILFERGVWLMPAEQLPDGRYGLASISPILLPDSLEQVVLGYLVSHFILPDAIAALIPEVFQEQLLLEVRDSDDQVIYSSARKQGLASVDWLTAFDIDLDGDGSAYQFHVGLSPAGVAATQSRVPQAALFGGLAVTTLLALISFLGLRAGHQARGLAGVNRQLKREMADHEDARKELAYLASHDPLTGLPNRQSATQRIGALVQQGVLAGEECALFFMDLDQFKDINDSMGHQVGDQLLQAIAPRIAGMLREEDFLGRHGGDEFLLAVRRHSREQIEQLADNLLRSMDRGFVVGTNRFFISASIGIAYLSDSGASVDGLIQNADTALFRAKSAGRNQYAIFTPEMFSQAQQRLHMSRDIRNALDRQDFRVVYQPIVSSSDGSLIGLEALCRWQHPDGHWVPPQEFIRVAEETGLIGRLGQFVLEQAMTDLTHWQGLGVNTPWVSVNVSGVQFRDANFVESVSLLLHRFRLKPEQLHLEITEEVLIENVSANRRLLKRLDDIGIRIVVDDFGVGYSSLAYLKNFPISIVKIDRSFIKELVSDAEDQAITHAICRLSDDLGMHTVAEGVETADHLELLQRFSCSYCQGFLFSRPVSASEIEQILTQQIPWADFFRPVSVE